MYGAYHSRQRKQGVEMIFIFAVSGALIVLLAVVLAAVVGVRALGAAFEPDEHPIPQSRQSTGLDRAYAKMQKAQNSQPG